MATKFRKWLERLQPEAVLGGADGENQQQNQGPRARGHSGMGEAFPDPRRDRAEAPKHGAAIRNVASAALRASTRLMRTVSPFGKRNLPSHRDDSHPQEITHTKKSPITTSLRNFLGPTRADQTPSSFCSLGHVSHPPLPCRCRGVNG